MSKASPDDWILVEDGVFRGVYIAVDGSTNEVVSLSTRKCPDSFRWRDVMPSVAEYSSLIVLDLANSRYLKLLHESVGNLKCLRVVKLTRCERLEQLPYSFSGLTNLEEVSVFCAPLTSALTSVS